MKSMARTIIPWPLWFLMAFGFSGLVATSGVRARRPLNAMESGALILFVVCTLSMLSCAQWILNGLLGESTSLFDAPHWFFFFPLQGLHFLAGAVMLVNRPATRHIGAVYFGLLCFMGIVGTLLRSIGSNLGLWPFAFWSLEYTLANGLVFCLGLVLGQPDTYPETKSGT